MRSDFVSVFGIADRVVRCGDACAGAVGDRHSGLFRLAVVGIRCAGQLDGFRGRNGRYIFTAAVALFDDHSVQFRRCFCGAVPGEGVAGFGNRDGFDRGIGQRAAVQLEGRGIHLRAVRRAGRRDAFDGDSTVFGLRILRTAGVQTGQGDRTGIRRAVGPMVGRLVEQMGMSRLRTERECRGEGETEQKSAYGAHEKTASSLKTDAV